MKFLPVVAVIILTFLVLIGSSLSLPMVWDEGNAIRRSDQILKWFSDGPIFSRDALQQGWPYTTQVEGHPAFYGLVIATGRTVSSSFLSPLTAARFGPICLFALAVGAVFWRVRDRAWRIYVSGGACPHAEEKSHDSNAGTSLPVRCELATDFSAGPSPAANSLIAAVGSVVAILLLPRLFAHAHFASFDGPLTACWLLAWALFDASKFDTGKFDTGKLDTGEESRRKRLAKNVLFGIALGMTLSCKATGWIAPIPLIVWAFCYRDRRAMTCLAIGLPVALLTFYILNPALWLSPIDGFLTFLQLNFHRDELGLNLSTQFLGQLYNLGHPLPWYNTLFWVAVTVPVPLLILLVVELITIIRHPSVARFEILVAMNAAVLLIVRALPGVPVHDGIRLFLPAFGFIAILIGFGAARLWQRFGKLGPICVVTFYLAAGSSLVWFAPHWLSYYNLLIGGPSGAAAVGMEPTYYWDSLDDETLAWINANTEPSEKVLFVDAPSTNLALLRQWGKLKPEVSRKVSGQYRWQVIQNRPGSLQPDSLRRIQKETPIYRKNLGSGGIGPWRRDVLLLGIYPE